MLLSMLVKEEESLRDKKRDTERGEEGERYSRNVIEGRMSRQRFF